MKKRILILSFFCFIMFINILKAQQVQVGADQIDEILKLTNNKKVGLVINHTSCQSNGKHLLDALIEQKVNIVKIFAPEHGIRGNADNGEEINNEIDKKTGLSILSLHGKHKKPTAEQVTDLDIMIYDMQDVGARFYTYISTMHYVMETCAENGKTCIVLDRPNPNDYIDGPVLKLKFSSFIGMHQIPILYGLTPGELAQMINGEGWLEGQRKCNLSVIKLKGWQHGQPYTLPIEPSPNLPNQQAVRLFPSLCFFEGTNISIGRGTPFPFQVIGGESNRFGDFTFTPKPSRGSKEPPLNGKKCYGTDLRNYPFEGGLTLHYLIDFYKKSPMKSQFFERIRHTDILAGTDELRLQIRKGMSEKQIRKLWQKDLDTYKTMRKKYVLYKEN